jgi:hypothetical protein
VEEAPMPPARHRQRDLFDPERPSIEMTPVQRAKLIELVQALLIEALMDDAGTSAETGDDEDHA